MENKKDVSANVNKSMLRQAEAFENHGQKAAAALLRATAGGAGAYSDEFKRAAKSEYMDDKGLFAVSAVLYRLAGDETGADSSTAKLQEAIKGCKQGGRPDAGPVFVESIMSCVDESLGIDQLIAFLRKHNSGDYILSMAKNVRRALDDMTCSLLGQHMRATGLVNDNAAD